MQIASVNETRFVPRRDVDRCRRNKIEPPTLNCAVVLKFRSRKKFQVIGISIGESGYISLVTFGSRSDVRGGQTGRADANYWQSDIGARSNNTRGSPSAPLFLFTSSVPDVRCISFGLPPRFHVKLLQIRDEVCVLWKKICRGNLNRLCFDKCLIFQDFSFVSSCLFEEIFDSLFSEI